MRKSDHIEKHETTLDQHTEKLKEFNHLIEWFNQNRDSYDELIEYYDSDLWMEDYEADNNGEFSSDLKRGVLSEDAIFNLIGDYYHSYVNALELITKHLKG